MKVALAVVQLGRVQTPAFKPVDGKRLPDSLRQRPIYKARNSWSGNGV